MIDYHTTTNIWLHLEEFYNRGLTPARAAEIITSMPDPGSSSLHLHTRTSGLNNNWIVETHLASPDNIARLVRYIEARLHVELEGADKAAVSAPSPAPDRAQVLAEVQDLLVRYMGVDPALCKPESLLERDLGMDSLDMVEFTMELEAHFGIDIPDERVDLLVNVQNVANLVLELQD